MKSRQSARATYWDEDFTIIRTTHGPIQGAKRHTAYKDTYYSYQRIPYAKPPVGALRFLSPQPIGKWTRPKICTQDSEGPLQMNPVTHQIQGSEDCLYLNVYVKSFQTEYRLPVMVFLYGDQFQFGEAGSKLVGPDYFMQEQVVLFSMNYRLGALGFLSLDDPQVEVPGNAGLRDQLAALHWINKNCARFNGDPDNITLFGNGSGAVSTHFHTLEVNSKGLFHKAIFMSGSIFSEGHLIPRSDYAFRLAKKTRYEGHNVDKEVLNHLRNVDASQLVGVDVRTESEISTGLLFAFAPTIEPYVDDDCFIRLNPELLTKNSWGQQIPMMIGGTSFEGLFLTNVAKTYWRLVKDKPECFVPISVRNFNTLEENKKAGQEIANEYKMDPKFHRGEDALILKICEYFSYRYFWVSVHRFIQNKIKYGAMPTYLYRFDFDSPILNLSRIEHCGPKVRGVTHNDEVNYLFHRPEAPNLHKTSEEYKMIRCMVAMWTSFARNADPNCEEIGSIEWKPISEATPYLGLNISNRLTMMELPEAEKFPYWDKVYEKVDNANKQFDGKL